MPETVVVDASLAVMWAMPEAYSVQALSLAERWARTETSLLAPCLIISEITNALYKRVVRREIDLATAREGLAVVFGFGIEIREEPNLSVQAMKWAHRLRQSSAYDGQYVALAELRECPLWTGDRRLYQAAKPFVSWVHWVGQDKALSST